jgi:hypothetical protein
MFIPWTYVIILCYFWSSKNHTLKQAGIRCSDYRQLGVKVWWSCVFVHLPCICEYQCYMYVYIYKVTRNCGTKIIAQESFIHTNLISVPLQHEQGSCAKSKWGNHFTILTAFTERSEVLQQIFEKRSTFISPILLKNGKQIGSCTNNWVHDDD